MPGSPPRRARPGTGLDRGACGLRKVTGTGCRSSLWWNLLEYSPGGSCGHYLPGVSVWLPAIRPVRQPAKMIRSYLSGAMLDGTPTQTDQDYCRGRPPSALSVPAGARGSPMAFSARTCPASPGCLWLSGFKWRGARDMMYSARPRTEADHALVPPTGTLPYDPCGGPGLLLPPGRPVPLPELDAVLPGATTLSD